MGQLFSGLRQRGQKRPRDSSVSSSSSSSSSPLRLAKRESSSLLALRYVRGGQAGSRAFHSVVKGESVAESYGCHYHLYDTESPDAAHGVALGWSLSQASLSAFSLMTLCRVANSCHKKLALLDEEAGTGVLLKYTANL